jgi:hypothetical protein
MELMMNGLLFAASLFAGGYCWVLARRVEDLKSLDKGLGGSIVTLTRQIELARLTLEEARSASKDTRQDLGQLVAKADAAASQLKLLIAAAPVQPPAPAPVPRAAQPAPVTPLPDPLPAAAVEPEPLAAAPAAAPDPDVPKPRALAPVENPLRRAKPAAGPAHSEDEILEALSALAGVGR